MLQQLVYIQWRNSLLLWNSYKDNKPFNWHDPPPSPISNNVEVEKGTEKFVAFPYRSIVNCGIVYKHGFWHYFNSLNCYLYYWVAITIVYNQVLIWTIFKYIFEKYILLVVLLSRCGWHSLCQVPLFWSCKTFEPSFLSICVFKPPLFRN